MTLESAEQVADVCASIIVRLIDRRPGTVLGLATGDTPRRTYDRVVEACRRGEVSLATTTAVALDEYVGLPPEHPQSYRTFLLAALVERTDMPASSLHTPSTTAVDIDAACHAYESLLADLGGVDLQLLGIGTDGHIGFNEPGSSLSSRTRLKTLHPRTIEDNSRFFVDHADVPRHVITQGIATILDSRHAVLLATGASKAAAVAAMAEGPVTAMVPASALQLHPHVTVLIDTAAAGKLELIDYYRYTHSNKPRWQQY